MPRLIVTIDGVTLREVALVRERITIGRRPHNDVVIDNLAVSGEHAAIQRGPGAVFLEDLGSTNGTLLNGRAIQRAPLQHRDTIDIGKYRLRYIDEVPTAEFEKTMVIRSGSVPPPPVVTAVPEPAPTARIKVVSGGAAGREVPLVKVVTTLGRSGGAVAAITRRGARYTLAHVEGGPVTRLNGLALAGQPVELNAGDRLELAGVEMEFLLA